MWAKYADLLVNYSLSLQAGEKVLFRSTTLAEPLVRELLKASLQVGAIPHVWFELEDEATLWAEFGNDVQRAYINPLYEQAVNEFEAYLYIKSEHNLRVPSIGKPLPAELAKPKAALAKKYMDRTGTRDLKRSLCQFPTRAAAQEAGMAYADYEQFVFNACKLYADDPKAEWLKLRAFQQSKVDYLNNCTRFRYKSPDIDISFSTEGRIWINSDGQTNMPSGEMYTSPVENSVQGTIYFTHPVVFKGELVEGITLVVKDGEVVQWSAKQGQHILDEVFKLPGARYFGEAAIGTNFEINRFTRNILFDEKIGGTIHMAIGQSYYQTGGKNESPIHWDMIADMTQGGEIYADEVLIYKDGKFLI
jgi:aminopeptidase